MLLALVILPLLFAGLAFAIPSARVRPWLVPIGAAVNATLTVLALTRPRPSALGGWVVLDPLGKLVLAFLSLLYLLCALYAPAYLAVRPQRRNRIFCAALLAFFAMTTLVVLSHHLGLMWVAIEASTLSSAPLLYFNQNRRSLEATWKYLLIGSFPI